jgi:nucleotide-binding universal stress UspA family protein
VSAVDFTIASAVAVQTVVDLSRRSGARLTLVHAVTATDTAYSGGQALEVARNVRSETARISARLRRKIPADMRLRVDEHVTTGDPHRAILNVAKDVDADLIVMGVARRSRVDQALSGSTLRNVLRRTTVPILVLPVPAGARRCLDQTDGIEISLTPKSAVAGM